MAWVPYEDTCHMNPWPFGPQHVHFRVTHGAHTIGPRNHRWHHDAMSYPRLQPPTISNITIIESVEA